MEQENDPLEGYPLADAIDHAILMHREAHFAGHFPTMIDYYKQNGKGIQADFSIERLEELANLEQQLGQNLAVLYLAGNEAEKVANAKEIYKRLRDLYENEDAKSHLPRLIADLILTEDETAAEEIEAIVKEKGKIVPSLIHLLQTEDFYDPLFPGYGLAPDLAVKCLELIGDKRAIVSLFENLGHGDFFADDQIIKALRAIGAPAEEFLLRVVSGRPINEDNERAAIALIQFKDNEKVANACFDLLQASDVQKDPCLPTYLVLACADLKDEEKRKQLIGLSKDEKLPRALREDMKAIIKEWKEESV